MKRPIKRYTILFETYVRVNPFYDVIKKFSKESDDWSVDAWVVALCRFKGRIKVHSMSFRVKNMKNILDENNQWKLGNLLQFQSNYKYQSGSNSFWSSKMEDFQCCPVGGSGATGTPSQGFTGCLAVFYLLRGQSSIRPEFQTQKRVQNRESLLK